MRSMLAILAAFWMSWADFALAGPPPFPAVPRFIRQIYVAPYGADDQSGAGPARAMRSIRAALHRARQLGPGTEVVVRAGTYREGRLLIDLDGEPEAWHGLRAYPGERPVILGSRDWETIHVKSSYFLLEGLELDGSMIGSRTSDGRRITSAAELDRWGTAFASCLPSGENCGTGVHVGGTLAEPVHHVIVRDMIVHDFPGGGIQTGPGDFLLIEDNVTYGNAGYSLYGHSGISVFRSVAVASGEEPAYRIVVRRNLSYGNHQKVPSREIGSDRPTDGNGIVVDSNHDTGYPHRTLVENNLVVGNGGTGIHSYRSSHVDIVNNTSYGNGRNPAQDGGEILAVASSDVRIANNVAQAAPGRRLNGNWRNHEVVSSGNILYGTIPPELTGPGDILADPRLVAPSAPPVLAGFVPRPDSPAIDAAAGDLVAQLDHAGQPPAGRRDIGALERR